MIRARIEVRRRRARPIQYDGPPRTVYLPGWRWRVLTADGAWVDAGVAPTWRAAMALAAEARDGYLTLGRFRAAA